MAGKGDALRPMAVEEMTGVWPGEEPDRVLKDPLPCLKCGRDVRGDDATFIIVDRFTGAMQYKCTPKCPTATNRPKPPEPKDTPDAKPTLSVDRPGDPEPR